MTIKLISASDMSLPHYTSLRLTYLARGLVQTNTATELLSCRPLSRRVLLLLHFCLGPDSLSAPSLCAEQSAAFAVGYDNHRLTASTDSYSNSSAGST